MTLDIGKEVGDGAKPSPVDFDTLPTAVDDYKFGDPITRNNFAGFLVDDFKRSKGKNATQFYAWAWLKRHRGVDVASILKDFIDKNGLRNLTVEEQQMIQSEFDRSGRHKRKVNQIMVEEDRSFSSHLSRTIDTVITIYENQGNTLVFNNRKFRVVEPKEEILNMEKSDFLKWQATDGQNEAVLIPTGGPLSGF